MKLEKNKESSDDCTRHFSGKPTRDERKTPDTGLVNSSNRIEPYMSTMISLTKLSGKVKRNDERTIKTDRRGPTGRG